MAEFGTLTQHTRVDSSGTVRLHACGPWLRYVDLLPTRTARHGTEPEDGETASTAPFGSLQLLDLPRKPLEVIEHRRNQFLSAGVLRRQGVGKKVE